MKILSRAILFLLGFVVCGSAPTACAQDGTLPIRVETREVVVPVSVIHRFQFPNGSGDMEEGQEDMTGLLAKDFHVFEDGKEQKIRSVREELAYLWGVRDNKGFHLEGFCTPKGLWIGPDHPQYPFPTPSDTTYQSPIHVYSISYVPPASPEGSCHQIKVKVDRHSAAVYARKEYCKTKNSMSHVLSGTKLGKKVETNLESAQSGEIPVVLRATPLFHPSQESVVDVAVEFPWSSLWRSWEGNDLYTEIAVLGQVYDTTGTPVARFSEQACYASTKTWGYKNCPGCIRDRSYNEHNVIPQAYEAQLDLPRGDYVLKLVITDGQKFGRIEAPLKVDIGEGADNLAISGVVLSKRLHQILDRPAQFHPLVSKDYEFTPTADTTFGRDDRLFAYFEIQDLKLGNGAKVSFQMKVTDAKTGSVKLDTGMQPAESWVKPGNPVIAIAREITIDELAAGEYRLDVKASDSLGNSTAWRSANFSVR